MTAVLTTRTRRVAAGAAVALSMAGAAVLTQASPAAAASSYIGSNSGGANVRSCPNTGCASYGYLPNGTGVTMLCWIDSQWGLPAEFRLRLAALVPAVHPGGHRLHPLLAGREPDVRRALLTLDRGEAFRRPRSPERLGAGLAPRLVPSWCTETAGTAGAVDQTGESAGRRFHRSSRRCVSDLARLGP